MKSSILIFIIIVSIPALFFLTCWISVCLENRKVKKLAKIGSIWEKIPADWQDSPWYDTDVTYTIIDVAEFEKDGNLYIKYKEKGSYKDFETSSATYFFENFRPHNKKQTKYRKLI